MIARFAGGVLGLFAFGVTATIGLVVGNPPMTIVTRALWALVIFCVVGLAVGTAAQAVINDFIHKQEEKLRSSTGERGAAAGSADEAGHVAGEAKAAD